MQLEDLKVDKEKIGKKMVEDITEIVKTCGKRDSGSEGEEKAIKSMKDMLNGCVDEAFIEAFDVHPAAFMSWIYFTVTMLLAAFVCVFFVPVVSIILTLLGCGLMVGEFVLYKQIIDKAFKKKISHNLTAVKKPKGEIKRRIFISGHSDAAFEWVVNYYMGGKAFVAHFLVSVLGVVYFFAVSIAALCINGFAAATLSGGIKIAALAGLVFVPFWIAMYILWNEKRVVNGANDDLTGCMMGIELLQQMQEKGVELENTEVGVIITGSEEAGLRGAKAWAEKHRNDYKDVETIIFNFDTLREGKFLSVNKFDLNNTVKCDAHPCNLFTQAAKNVNVPCEVGSVPLGATDAAALNQAGFKAVAITAMNHDLQNYYHTRRDDVNNMDEKCLADAYEVMVEAVKLFDEGK